MATGEEELEKRPLAIAAEEEEEEEEEDPPLLSSEALEALREFLAERNSAGAEEEDGEEVKMVSEDWNLSQFWYDRHTAETVAQEVLHLSERFSSSIACISCSTLYAYLKLFPSLSPQQLNYILGQLEA